ncbi:hypothetical protein WJX72_006636 [[Myrmecia] bisecta]|uniref:Protein DAMAGED DNA-BINDING 2 n=1 Tax=[Myrmecia] bisecta TaxID=41462 RepID=A0AAW1PPA3_9CHLO
MPRWVVARPAADDEEEEEQESSEEESDGDEAVIGFEEGGHGIAEQAGEEEEAQEAEQQEEAQAGPRKKQKISVKLGQRSLVCHVCGKPGHNAGFVGSVYLDCPNRPCYLCKRSGHTTMTCPYRIAPEHGCVQASSVSSDGVLGLVRKREQDGRKRELPMPHAGWQVDAAVLKLHSRRCTCLEFHPSKDNIVLSGDKKGQVAIWDFDKVYERTVYNLQRALCNNLRFLHSGDGMSCCSASSDGTLKVFDIETGFDSEVMNLNPEGWIDGVSNERNWGMFYGMDVCTHKGLVIAGDSKGLVHFADPREPKTLGSEQLHKKGNKVTSVHVNPADENVVLTGSNDWTARMSDIRCLSGSAASTSASASTGTSPVQLASLAHKAVVNAAYFSPITGGKIMTTCIDNRLRIWDSVYSTDRDPDREIVHSHDFNRYLTPFRAEWDPKDPNERLLVIGRYISEDFGGVALHPVDLMDASTGQLLQQLKDPNLTTICPVNKPHPRLDVIISGSSRSLYAWRPITPGEGEEGTASKASSSKSDATTTEVLLQGSAHFVFYDAEDGADEKKKRKAGAGAGPGGKDAKGKGKKK